MPDPPIKFLIARKGTLEFYYSFESYLYEVTDRGAIIDTDLSADAIAHRHGFTNNSSHPISPFLPPLIKVKNYGDRILSNLTTI